MQTKTISHEASIARIMARPPRENTLSLAGIFFLITYVAIVLVVDTRFGFPVASLAVILPAPPIAYLLIVRHWTKRQNVEYERRSTMANVMLGIGFFFVITISLGIVGAAMIIWPSISAIRLMESVFPR